MIRNTLPFLLVLVFLCSCNVGNSTKNIDVEMESTALYKIDNDFSTLSQSKGLKNAYLEYIDSNGVILRPNSLPIIDADAVDYILAMNDSAYSITWKPSMASVSQMGDLGYSYGVYEINTTAKDTTLYGTYITIWKKQKDGNWKFVLQSNNEGIGDNE